MHIRLLPLLYAFLLCTANVASVAGAQETQEGPLPQLNRHPAQSPDDQDPQAPAQSRHDPKSNFRELDNEAILRMTQAEVGDSILLQTIRTQPGNYRTAPDDLIALKKAGVSEPVIAAMLARNSGMAQRPDPKPIEVTPLSPDVDDPGLYFKIRKASGNPSPPSSSSTATAAHSKASSPTTSSKKT